MVVTKRKGGGKSIKGVKHLVMKEVRVWVLSGWCHIQMMYFIIVHLKKKMSLSPATLRTSHRLNDLLVWDPSCKAFSSICSGIGDKGDITWWALNTVLYLQAHTLSSALNTLPTHYFVWVVNTSCVLNTTVTHHQFIPEQGRQPVLVTLGLLLSLDHTLYIFHHT